jgi:hypothetical protein
MNNEQLMEEFNTSITENFFQELTVDVWEKYEVEEEVEEGEFGPIYKVKRKELGNSKSSFVRVYYCLKTIHLNRVSRVNVHQEDIKNEITALKVGCSLFTPVVQQHYLFLLRRVMI